MKNSLIKKTIATFITIITIIGAQPASAAHDLAERGNGFEHFQWFCLPDINRGDMMGAVGGAVSPFALRKTEAGREWYWTGKHPFNKDLVKQARGVIEPSDKTAPGANKLSTAGLPDMRLEVYFKEGVSWRGIPVSSYASHAMPSGAYQYFTTNLTPKQLRTIFEKDNPKSKEAFASFERDERQGALEVAGDRSFNKLRLLASKAGHADKAKDQHAAEHMDRWMSTQFNTSAALLPSDKAAPGETKIGCFGRGWETGSPDELPPVFEVR